MHSRGFTLVELILVIVVLGILAAVVGPRFFDRQTFDDRLFYEEALAAVRHAQKLALASGCRTQVQLDSSLRLRRAAGCGSGLYTASVPGADDLPVPENISLSGNTFPVTFDSLGEAEAAAAVTIGGHVLRVHAPAGWIETP